MGVPGFYKWLIQRYPLIRKSLDNLSRPKINNFYIDFNCIIYNALRLVSASNSNLELLFDEVCRYLDLLVQIIRPETVLFIAVDGPAPFAKCAQQRTRRFLAARDSKGGSFDTTCVSVGTEFMEKMNQRLIEFISLKSKEDQIWMKPQIIYSSHRVPGEGEHKFFDYIRTQMKLNPESTPKLVHCVYSPDADLIFLGLQTKLPYFYILRELDGWIGPNEKVGNGKFNKLKAADTDFELLCLSICRELFHLEYSDMPDVNRTIDDFAAFCFFIGNDFIPHFPDISIQNGNFEQIIEAYQTTIMKEHLYLIEDGKINKTVLKKLLLSYAHPKPSKSTMIKDRSDQDLYNTATEYLRVKYPDQYAENPIELEKQLAFSILDSFDWVFQYYTQGCPSWSWCYPYHYAPHVIIIAKYCEEHVSKFELNRPPTPLEQLLCILPPQSCKFLPEAAQPLMTSPELQKFYPTKFEVDLNGRNYEHEGVVLIPFVDINLIREEISKIQDQLTEEEVTRNTLMTNLSFENGQYHNFSIEKEMPVLPTKYQTCFPSLNCANIHFQAQLVKLKVNIFNQPSTSASLKLQILTKYQTAIPKDATQVESLLNAPVLINWPYLCPALVMEIFDKNGTLITKEGTKKLSTEEANMKITQLIQHFRQKTAIDITGTSIVLVVKPLIATRMNEDQYKFQPRLTYYPYQLSVSCHHTDFIHRYIAPPKTLPKVDSLAVIIDGPNQSKKCIIKSVDEATQEAEILVLHNEKQLIDLSELIAEDEKKWIKIDSILHSIGLDYDSAKLLLTSLPIFDKGSNGNYNMAFTAIAEKKVLDGFCRKNRGEYEFSREFQGQLYEYITSEHIGYLIDIIRDTNIERLKSISASSVYEGSKPAECLHKVKEMQTYIKDHCPGQYFLIDESISIVSQDTLYEIERKLTQQPEFHQEQETSATIYEKLDNLVWPGKPKLFLQKKCEKGSRVINLAPTGPIPFGERGYVVGVDKFNYQYHIILDKECKYGTNLRKRLLTKRGYIAKIDDLFFY